MRVALAALLLLAPVLRAQEPAAPATSTATTATLGAPGPHPVDVSDRAFTDEARGRRIAARVYAPRDVTAGSPLIVFSPGLGGNERAYVYFGQHMASHGFTTIVIDHPGTDTAAVLGAGTPARGLLRAGQDPVARRARPADVRFVLDEVTRLHDTDPVLARVDLSKIAVAGHSYGAWTALAVVGQTVDDEGETRSFRDPRVRCAIAMSPQGPGTIGLTDASWSDIHVPVHTMTGTADTAIGTRRVADRRVAFDRMPPGDKYHLTIRGAKHDAFGERADPERDPRHHGWILAAATAFLRAYLEDDAAARAWLEAGALQRDSGGEVVQERR
jgi:predicted dienelactone hydrolase